MVIRLSVESARQLMIAAGYWKPRKGSAISVHPMREHRARLGELVQIDGSPHDWFEGRANRCTLLVFIDDATGTLMQLRFAPTEPTLGYMHTPCMTISWHTGCRWHSTATNTASSASMPKRLIRRLKHNLGGRHGNWASSAFTPTAHKRRGAWNVPTRHYRTGCPRKCGWMAYLISPVQTIGCLALWPVSTGALR